MWRDYEDRQKKKEAEEENHAALREKRIFLLIFLFRKVDFLFFCDFFLGKPLSASLPSLCPPSS